MTHQEPDKHQEPAEGGREEIDKAVNGFTQPSAGRRPTDRATAADPSGEGDRERGSTAVATPDPSGELGRKQERAATQPDPRAPSTHPGRAVAQPGEEDVVADPEGARKHLDTPAA